jgi:predicted enzyme related to lactoylglutathione lyase
MRSRLSLTSFRQTTPTARVAFWSEFLGTTLEHRAEGEGEGWQTSARSPAVRVHRRGRGPGDSFSLPYFVVSDLETTLERVRALGGTVIHPGAQWATCKDSEGSLFGLALI